MNTLDRFRGCLTGLACGDAVGTTVEFRPRGSFSPLTDMAGGGPFALQPGQWTDDTSMALCLATSLLECDGFDAADQMRRYCRWMDEGYLSSTGDCFDIGMTAADALRRFRRSGEPFSGSNDPRSAGNGCLMRLAPVPMFYFGDRETMIEQSGNSARTTHGARECVDASRLFGTMLWLALSGATKDVILLGHGMTDIQSERLASIARGDYRDRDVCSIRGNGYVVDSLEAALWCFARTDSFGQAVLLAANLGEDADTTAAICGQLAGAFYGLGGIPVRWKSLLTMVDLIKGLADRLFEHATMPAASGTSVAADTVKTSHDLTQQPGTDGPGVAKKQVILQAGTEGGTVTLSGIQSGTEWQFRVETDESALDSLVDEDLPASVQRPWVTTWHAALQQLDRYPWTKMYPLSVHEGFRDRVFKALQARETEIRIDWDRWSDVLDSLRRGR